MEPPLRTWLPAPSNYPVSLRLLLHTHTLTHAHAHTHGISRSVSRHCALSPSKYPPGLLPDAFLGFSRLIKKGFLSFFKKKKKSTVFPLYPFKGAFSLLQVIPKRGCASERNEFSPPLAKTHDFSQRTALTPLATIALVSLGMLDKLDIRSR